MGGRRARLQGLSSAGLGVTPPRVRRPVRDRRARGRDRRRPRQRRRCASISPALLVMGGDAQRALEHAQAALAHRARQRRGARRRPRRRAGARRPRPRGELRAPAARFGDGDAAAALAGRRPDGRARPLGRGSDDARRSRSREGFTELDPEGLIEADRPQVTLDDVGGLEEVKARLDAAFLAPLRNPELRAYYGKSLRGGLLLYGPPGCGKTFLARAVAGELGARFFALGLSDVLDMWLGESERKLHDAFQAARRAAPCVLFLDELDALGQKRSHLRHSRRAQRRQPAARRARRRPGRQRGRLRARRDQPPVGRRHRAAAARPAGPHRARAPARPAGARGDPAQGARGAPDQGHRPRPSSPAAPTAAAAPTSSTSSSPPPSSRCRSRSRPGRCTRSPSASSSRPRPRPARRRKAWFGIAHNYALYANDGGQYDDLLAYIRTHKLL